MMENENRVAVVAILVEKKENVGVLNAILSDYSDYIIGRMGLPCRQKNVNCITVVLDAPQKTIDALCKFLDSVDGISSKAVVSHV